VVALDIFTPLAIADWLIQVILVWVASTLGDRKEMRFVFGVASLTVLCGLWSSPASAVPFWTGALNRITAIAVMATMVHTAEARRAAEEAEQEAAAQIKILQGLIPICCVCKSIRDAQGEWHQLEAYLSANSEAQLSHGLCPRCAAPYWEKLHANI
jgi:hypothetical protein